MRRELSSISNVYSVQSVHKYISLQKFKLDVQINLIDACEVLGIEEVKCESGKKQIQTWHGGGGGSKPN